MTRSEDSPHQPPPPLLKSDREVLPAHRPQSADVVIEVVQVEHDHLRLQQRHRIRRLWRLVPPSQPRGNQAGRGSPAGLEMVLELEVQTVLTLHLVQAQSDRRDQPFPVELRRPEIEEKVAGVDEEAVKRYGSTLQKAGELGVSNEWTRLARVRANAYKPDVFPMVKDEHIDMQMETPQ